MIVLSLAACDFDSAPADKTLLTGVFIDGAVEGLHYETATQSGTKISLGECNYFPGETVTLIFRVYYLNRKILSLLINSTRIT